MDKVGQGRVERELPIPRLVINLTTEAADIEKEMDTFFKVKLLLKPRYVTQKCIVYHRRVKKCFQPVIGRWVATLRGDCGILPCIVLHVLKSPLQE